MPLTSWPTSTDPAAPTARPRRINGRIEHLRGSALGFRNPTNYIARPLLQTGGFRPNYTLDCGEPEKVRRLGYDFRYFGNCRLWILLAASGQRAYRTRPNHTQIRRP